MFRYIIVFKKEGLLRFTSHLDMLRLFKRGFKKCGVPLCYSQGFNPHPKMGFAQPLSLGYCSDEEILEFETLEAVDCNGLLKELESSMALGIKLKSIAPFENNVKSLASIADSGVFTIEFPKGTFSADDSVETLNKILKAYLDKEEIIAEKKGKRDKKPKEINIRPMIRKAEALDGNTVRCSLDLGSTSNLSPELIIKTLLDFCNINLKRHLIKVTRNKVEFKFPNGEKLIYL